MAAEEYNIEWKRSAVKELRRLPKETVTRVLEAVEGLRINPFPTDVRKLSGAEHTYRIREGSYRIIYSVYSSRLVVEVIRVGHRKDGYRQREAMNIGISDLLKKKAARRRALARLPFEEKVEIVRRLRELSREIKESRDENEALRRARESAADR